MGAHVHAYLHTCAAGCVLQAAPPVMCTYVWVLMCMHTYIHVLLDVCCRLLRPSRRRVGLEFTWRSCRCGRQVLAAVTAPGGEQPACTSPEGISPEGISPHGTSPHGTSPHGTSHALEPSDGLDPSAVAEAGPGGTAQQAAGSRGQAGGAGPGGAAVATPRSQRAHHAGYRVHAGLLDAWCAELRTPSMARYGAVRGEGAKLKSPFLSFDTAPRDGYVSMREFYRMVVATRGVSPPWKEVENVLAKLDGDGDGFISAAESHMVEWH